MPSTVVCNAQPSNTRLTNLPTLRASPLATSLILWFLRSLHLDMHAVCMYVLYVNAAAGIARSDPSAQLISLHHRNVLGDFSPALRSTFYSFRSRCGGGKGGEGKALEEMTTTRLFCAPGGGDRSEEIRSDSGPIIS